MLIDGFTLFGSWPGLPYDHPVDHLTNGLDRYKLDRACTLSSKGIFFDAAAGNEATWEACQQDARLCPIGVADPRAGGEAQVEYCVQQGFHVMALFPVAQDWAVTSLPAKGLLRRIADANLPVIVEAPRDGDASAIYEATREYQMPVILLDVSQRALAEAIEVLRARPNTFVTTRLLCGGDTIEYLTQAVGADRLIFASRFPISCFSSAFLTAKFATLTDADRALVMGENMARLLG